MIVLMNLMLIHITNMHIVTYGADNRVQSEKKWIEVRETIKVLPITIEHVLLILLKLIVLSIQILAIFTNSIIFQIIIIEFRACLVS